jgi:hypothetical protein
MNPNRSIVGSELSRVHDPEKAHVMALAVNREETNAAGIRYLGNEALKLGGSPDDFQPTVDDLAMPERYRDVKADTGLDDPDSDVSVEGLVHEINNQQARADEIYEFTAEAHDKLKATER